MPLDVKIKKRLGKFQLDVNFSADRDIVALLGASGCGKSLTLKCIAGIEKPDEGRIVLDGRVLFDSQKKINLPPQKRKVGYLFQQYALFPNMTVAENIAAGAHGKPKAQRKGIVAEKIQTLQLGGLENKHPGQLSGGQQQRVALARILASEPEAVLFDEPFSALDTYLKWQLEMKLANVLSEYKGICIWVSHDREEVYRNCRRICIIDNGQSEMIRDKEDLFSSPNTMSAAMLSGCNNYFQAESTGSRDHVYIPEWDMNITSAKPVQSDTRFVGIRAQNIRLAQNGDKNSIKCRVVREIEELLEMTIILQPEGSQSDTAQLRMELHKSEWEMMKRPDNVIVSIAPENILLLQ